MKKLLLACISVALFMPVAQAKSLAEYENVKLKDYYEVYSSNPDFYDAIMNEFGFFPTNFQRLNDEAGRLQTRCAMNTFDPEICNATISQVVAKAKREEAPVKLKTLDEYQNMTLREFSTINHILESFKYVVSKEYGNSIGLSMWNQAKNIQAQTLNIMNKCDKPLQEYPNKLRNKIARECNQELSIINNETIFSTVVNPVEKEAIKRGEL